MCITVLLLTYPATKRAGQVRVDWLGAGLLFSAISAVLLALGTNIGPAALGFAAAAVVLVAGFVAVERRSADPILPIGLLRNPLIARTIGVTFLVGTALFGAVAFIPLFVQGVLGATATQAGRVLMPLFLGWVVMSIVSAHLTARVGYRRLAVTGSALLTGGFVGLSVLDAESSRNAVGFAGLFIGSGMGLSMLSLLLAVQHGVARTYLGLATSLNQFSRSVGAAVGIAAMGALLARGLSGISIPGGAEAIAAGGTILTGAARLQFATALNHVFIAGAVLAATSLVATLFLPAVDFAGRVSAATGEQMLAAEMANLDPEGEPVAVPEG
jgi:Na+/melibiose symporter-like transporter